MFDPEKVERWTCEGSTSYMESGDNRAVNSRREYVIATDYDQLLELYNECLEARHSDQPRQSIGITQIDDGIPSISFNSSSSS